MDPELAARARKLRSQGWTYETIGTVLHVSITTAWGCCHLEEYRKRTRGYYEAQPKRGRLRRQVGRKQVKLRWDVIAMLGGKCAKCSNADHRVLQVNHLLDGGGKADRERYPDSRSFYRAIFKGERTTSDLNVLCASCSCVYDHERGCRSPDKLHIATIDLLGGKCAFCGITDLRVLQVNHVEGGGKRDRAKYGGRGLYRAILNGTRGTDGLNVLCANCNVIHEYNRGKIGKYSMDAGSNTSSMELSRSHH